jgi:cytochrome c oxidase cbb3-type subunit III
MKISFTPALRALSVIVFASAALSAKQAPQSLPGEGVLVQNCAFCHGRDAGGGEEGPDLTRSKLVADDVGGDKIGPVVLNGRQEKGMPRFKLADQEIKDLAAYIHAEKKLAETQKGGRRGVEVADLQTGNVEAGKAYFNGAGKCAGCHSPTGDLAGVASRFEGLKLEQRLLYPRGAVPSIVVTLATGEKLSGKLAYQDEFNIGMHDTNGWYHSWPVSSVKFAVTAPAEEHAELLAKYTDDDIHNLMAYLQTLR